MITKRSLQNLSALMILSAIGRYQSKRKVAEVMSTSIDTVNKYVSNLEHSLGLQLVINNSKGCHLTNRATHIVEQVKGVQEVLDQIYSQRPENNKYKGDVVICMPLAASSNMLPYDVPEFIDEYPDIKIVSINTLDSPNCEELGVDLGIVTSTPEKFHEYSLISKNNVKCGFFANPRYLNKYGTPKSMDDLIENHRIISGQYCSGRVKGWDEILQKAKHVCYSSNSTFSVAEVIRYGLGIGLMPLRFKDEGFVHLDNIKFEHEAIFYLVANNNTKDIPRVKAVSEYYKNVLSRM